MASEREEQVAKALRYIGEENYNLFGGSDQQSLLTLIEDFFCEDNPQEMSSGKSRPVVFITTIHGLLHGR